MVMVRLFRVISVFLTILITVIFFVPELSYADTTTGLIGWWKLDGNANDETGIYDGTINGPVVIDGKIEQAYLFDGVDDIISVTDIEDIDGASQLTVSAWIKVSSLNRDNDVIAKGTHTTYQPLLFWRDDVVGQGSQIGNINAMSVLVTDEGGHMAWTASPSGSLNDSDWHHVLFTFTADSLDGLKIYVDGINFNSASTVDVESIKLNSDIVTIGSATGGSALNIMNGIIDDVRIYNRSLSSHDVMELYTAGMVPTVPQNLSATAQTQRVDLSWEAPVSDGGFAITDYTIEYKLSTDSEWTIFADGVSIATSGSVTGLTNDSSYDFRVSAVNEKGQGVPSEVVSAIPYLTDAYWVGGTGNWSDATNHWASVSGGTPGAGNLPVPATNVHFDSNSGSGTVTINTTGVTVTDLDESNTNITIALGVNGMTTNGNVTVNKTISGTAALTVNGTDNTITGGNAGTISAPLAMTASTTVFVDTNKVFTATGIISGSYSLTKTGQGRLDLSAVNSFRGLVIKSGTVKRISGGSAWSFGSGSITLGDDSGGSNDATLAASSVTITNPIIVAANTTGILSIAGTNTTWSGGVTGNNDFYINNSEASGAYIVTFSTGSINNVGRVINASTGVSSLGVTISSVIGSNVTGVVQNSNVPLTLSGNNTFSGGVAIKSGTVRFSSNANALGTGTVILGDDSGINSAMLINNSGLTVPNNILVASGSSGTLTISGGGGSSAYSGNIELNNDVTLINGSPGVLTISGNITGIGNIILKNNSTGNNNTFLSGSINNVGTVTNAGVNTSGAVMSVSAIIGSNVTSVIQNSTTSSLILSGSNAFGELIIKKGTGVGQTSANALGAGSVTLGDSAGGNENATLDLRSSLVFANPIILASNTTGTLSIINRSNAVNGSNYTAVVTGGITGNNSVHLQNASCNRNFPVTTGLINNDGNVTNSSWNLPNCFNNVYINSVVGDNVDKVINDSAPTSNLTLTGNNSFGELVIKKGTVVGQSSANAFGAGTITLGDEAGGNNNAILTGASSLTFPNSIVLASNTTGSLIINNSGTGSVSPTFSGGISGNNNLSIINSWYNGSSITFSSGLINNSGTITINSTGQTGAGVVISSNIGGNVTGVIQNSPTTLTLLGDNSFPGDVIIKKGTVSGQTSANAFGVGSVIIGDTDGGSNNATLSGGGNLIFQNPIVLASNTTGTLSVAMDCYISPNFSGGISGANNLVIKNNCFNGSVLTFSLGQINNSGYIFASSSGQSSADLLINSVIGPNVIGLVKTGPNTLTLSGNNSTISGDVTISAGTLALSGTTNLNVAGNWTNNGTFIANQSTVTFTEAEHNITGTNTFYNVIAAPGSTLSLSTSTTQTIGNNFSCTGTSDKYITINSTESGVQGTLSKSSGTVDCNYLSLLDSNATGGATWNAGSNSYVTTNVTGWIGGMTFPGTPINVSGTAGNAQVNLLWGEPTNDGGSAVTDYIVEYKLYSDTEWTIFADGVTDATSTTVLGLENDSSYDFRVTAVNVVGNSSASDITTVVLAGLPGIPGSVSLVRGNGQVEIFFTAPASDGGSPITSYTVTSDPGSITAQGASSPIVVTGLTNGTPYTFTVTATNMVGTSSPSEATEAVTPGTIASAPQNFAVTVQGSSVDLSWCAPVNDGGLEITDYVIEYKLTTGGDWVVFADGLGTSTIMTVVGLSNGNSYDFRVRAVNDVGQGAYSSIVTASPGEPAQVIIRGMSGLIVPDITADIRITNEGEQEYEYQYSWCVNDASGNVCGGNDDVFSSLAAKLIQSGENFDTTLSATVPAAGNYWFHINAMYGSETSTASQSFTATASFPDAPTDVVAVAGNSQAVVSFTAPASSHGSAITVYSVTSNPGGITAIGGASPITVTGLTNGTTYRFSVTATNAIGTGPASTESQAITPTTVPTAPIAVSAVAGESQIALSWQAPVSNGGSSITDYVLEYKLSSASEWVVYSESTSDLTTAIISGLQNSAQYDVRISAVNVSGRGVASSIVSSSPVASSSKKGGFLTKLFKPQQEPVEMPVVETKPEMNIPEEKTSTSTVKEKVNEILEFIGLGEDKKEKDQEDDDGSGEGKKIDSKNLKKYPVYNSSIVTSTSTPDTAKTHAIIAGSIIGVFGTGLLVIIGVYIKRKISYN